MVSESLLYNLKDKTNWVNLYFFISRIKRPLCLDEILVTMTYFLTDVQNHSAVSTD